MECNRAVCAPQAARGLSQGDLHLRRLSLGARHRPHTSAALRRLAQFDPLPRPGQPRIRRQEHVSQSHEHPSCKGERSVCDDARSCSIAMSKSDGPAAPVTEAWELTELGGEAAAVLTSGARLAAGEQVGCPIDLSSRATSALLVDRFAGVHRLWRGGVALLLGDAVHIRLCARGRRGLAANRG